MKQVRGKEKNSLRHAVKTLRLSMLCVLLYALVGVSSGLAETVTVTIAQTNNLNGRLFAYKSSG